MHQFEKGPEGQSNPLTTPSDVHFPHKPNKPTLGEEDGIFKSSEENLQKPVVTRTAMQGNGRTNKFMFSCDEHGEVPASVTTH